MNDELRSKFDIPVDHEVNQVATKWEQRKGQDTDIYHYEQVDSKGNIVARYIVRDSTSIYSPNTRHVSIEKI